MLFNIVLRYLLYRILTTLRQKPKISIARNNENFGNIVSLAKR